jgi:hypothetical protein
VYAATQARSTNNRSCFHCRIPATRPDQKNSRRHFQASKKSSIISASTTKGYTWLGISLICYIPGTFSLLHLPSFSLSRNKQTNDKKEREKSHTQEDPGGLIKISLPLIYSPPLSLLMTVGVSLARSSLPRLKLLNGSLLWDEPSLYVILPFVDEGVAFECLRSNHYGS